MDIWFYHLTRQPLEKALPVLLEKALERDWRVIVQTSPARLKALDELLWSYAPESFLPHGIGPDADAPILLTDNHSPNGGAQLRICLDGADVAPSIDGGYERVIVIFDGNDEAELAAARRQWASLKAGGHVLAYWQQTEGGGWQKKA